MNAERWYCKYGACPDNHLGWNDATRIGPTGGAEPMCCTGSPDRTAPYTFAQCQWFPGGVPSGGPSWAEGGWLNITRVGGGSACTQECPDAPTPPPAANPPPTPPPTAAIQTPSKDKDCRPVS